MATRTFRSVWYLPKENEVSDGNILAYYDKGTLTISDDSVEFLGKKGTVKINGIRQISFGKQGRDFVNNWVKIEYGTDGKAFFADGSWRGWGGIFGGTKRILASLQHLSKQ